jgi:hypothetical protein
VAAGDQSIKTRISQIGMTSEAARLEGTMAVRIEASSPELIQMTTMLIEKHDS